MNIVSIQFAGKAPVYQQLSAHIQKQISELKPEIGSRLPSIRLLAKQFGINNGTVVRAYKDLEQKGFVHGKKGSGYTIVRHTDAMEIICLKDTPLLQSQIDEGSRRKLNFASATPNPSMFPVETFKECLNYVLERDQGYAFEYQEGSGYLPLRESLCAYFLQEQAVQLDPAQVVIVSGAQQGIDMIAKTYIQAGDTVLTENPTYPGAIRAFESRGAQIIGIPMDQDGMKLLDLETAIMANRPKLLYMMSRYQNPTSICYSKHKIKQILSLAKKYDFIIIEDDSLSELSYQKEMKDEISRMIYGHERVIVVKSLSKLLMPGLRMGFLILPQTELASVLRAKYVTDISSSGFMQRTVDIYFRSGRWGAHLESMRALLYENYQAMKKELEALSSYGVTYCDPKGGVYFWLYFPLSISVYELQRRCSAVGVQFVSGHFFTVKNNGDEELGKANEAIRFSFAAVHKDEISKGIAILKQCIEDMLEEQRREKYRLPWI